METLVIIAIRPSKKSHCQSLDVQYDAVGSMIRRTKSPDDIKPKNAIWVQRDPYDCLRSFLSRVLILSYPTSI